jgi:hypothetical protein
VTNVQRIVQSAIEGNLDGGFMYEDEDEDDDAINQADLVPDGIVWQLEGPDYFEEDPYWKLKAQHENLPLEARCQRESSGFYAAYYFLSTRCMGRETFDAPTVEAAIYLSKTLATKRFLRINYSESITEDEDDDAINGEDLIPEVRIKWTPEDNRSVPNVCQEFNARFMDKDITLWVSLHTRTNLPGPVFWADMFTDGISFPDLSFRTKADNLEDAVAEAKYKVAVHLAKLSAPERTTNMNKQWFEEGVVVPAKKHIDEISDILMLARRGLEADDLNELLEPYDAIIKHHEVFDKYPACAGGVFGTTLYVNPKALKMMTFYPAQLRALVTHELVHAGQMKGVEASGGDPADVDAKALAFCAKGGTDTYYNNQHQEVMALAKNAYDAMVARGLGYNQIMDYLRKDQAKNFSPYPMTKHNKMFNNYVHAYATKDQGAGMVESLMHDED